ncbi:MAG: hypothetical protein HY727_19975 [Candidatus Rokubacteria bacterium]|nr:hypothetical protein [Candidatus Rokubacteria bacterium]
MDYGDVDDYTLLVALPANREALKEFVRRHEAALIEVARLAEPEPAVEPEAVALRLASGAANGSVPVDGTGRELWLAIEAVVALVKQARDGREGCDA